MFHSEELPKGASISREDLQRINDGLAALATDPHAPRSLSVNVNIHVYNEYPKCIGDAMVNSAEEEKALIDAGAAKVAEESASEVK